MNIFRLERTEQFNREFGLHCRFAAAECHAAAALFVKGQVLHDDVQNFSDGFALTFGLERVCGTFFDADAAFGTDACARTFFVIDGNFPVNGFDGKRRTTSHARFAMQAFFRVPKNLQSRLLAFGIGAPRAFERTALEKNDRANAGAVVYAELLYVENHAVIGFHEIASREKFFCMILHVRSNVNVSFANERKTFAKSVDLFPIA